MALHPTCLRILTLGCVAFIACLTTPARADPFTISFTAVIDSSNSTDTDNLFQQGAGANLAGETLTGSVSIDPAPLTQACPSDGACYDDAGTGAISLSFTIGGVTQTVTSSRLMPMGGSPSGSVGIKDLADGGWNYLSVSASTDNNAIEAELGALFNSATLFSAYGGGDAADADAAAAIESLSAIGGGAGLVNGGVTLMTADGEHLDATLTGIYVDEPGSLTVLAAALAAIGLLRRLRSA